MNQQTIAFPLSGRTGFRMLIFALFSLIFTRTTDAQEIITYYQFDNSQRIRDVTVPEGYTYVYLETQGGDGGKATDGHHDMAGGKGAKVSGYLRIGTGDHQIPPGSTLRFIVGQKGEQNITEGSGGGGSGIVFREPAGAWRVLMVAGGGGGADSAHGHSGRGDANGGSCGSNSSGGHNGGNGEDGYKNGMGGYGYLAGINSAGEPVGIDGRKRTDGTRGGFGFGGGGGSGSNTGGGGGGYSGGASYMEAGGGGGGTYADPAWVLFQRIEFFHETEDPQHGYAMYRFSTASPFGLVRLAKDDTKCIDLQQGNTTNGANIQLFSCKNNSAQQWIVKDSGIQLAKDMTKCLDLDGSNTNSGTNIQLWDCNGTNAQYWIYDVANRMIRSGIDLNKCLDLVNGNTADGTNIQLYDCVYGNTKPNQQWTVDGVPSDLPTGKNLRIHLVMAPDKCLDIWQSYTGANGNNIQLYTCHTFNNSQYFTFDGRRIKMQLYPNKCLDLDHGNTANGANIQLWDCNGTDAQNWIYDGFSKAFRSAINPRMCIDVDHSNFIDGTNIQIWDCNGTNAQQFEIY